MQEAHDPYAALRHRDYTCLLVGSVLATMGARIQAVAVGWEILKRTDDAAALGLMGLVQFLPVLFFSLPAGQIVDQYNRKFVLQAALAVMALAGGGLAVLSWFQGPVWLIYACLLVASCGRAFSAPARWALLPLVVPAPLLSNAVTWNSSGMQLAFAVGPALGGLVLSWAGHPAAAYMAAGLATLAGMLLLTPVRAQAAPPPVESRSLESLLSGVRFVWQTKLLLAAITLDLFAVLLGGATALLPIYAEKILDIGPAGLGWLNAAPAVGAVVTALAIAHLPPVRRTGWALLLAVGGFGAATIAFGLSTDPVLSFVLLAVTGALDNISVVVRHTLMQVLTPDAMRGRVGAVNLVFISSSNELGALESGMAAAGFEWLAAEWQSTPLASGLTPQQFGAIASVVSGGIGTMVVVLLAMARWPQLLRLGPLHQLESPPPPDEATEIAGEVESPRLP